MAAAVCPMLQDKLTNEIFSILENKFLFGGKPSLNYINSNSPASNSAGKVRILSIDAGDAVLAANTLLHLQSILRAKSGNPTAHIADFFDVVAGSGAGGVLAGLLFTRGQDGGPIFTADESLNFLLDNYSSLNHYSSAGVFRRSSKASKVLKKVFGESTLKDTMKAVLIPCYDLTTGAPVLFSRADALEMDSCDFRMAGLCEATLADRAVKLSSADGTSKILAVGGRVAMSNPTAAAITHVLNNKKEFPLCNAVEDLLVVSLGGNGESDSAAAFTRIAATGAADVVDQAVSMAFGEWRRSNYVRIQGDRMVGNNESMNYKKKSKAWMVKQVEEILREKNVESVLFKGKKLVELTNMEKVEIFGGEVIKEEERRKNAVLPTVVLKNSNTTNSPRSSSATTLSTLSST